MVDVSGRVKVLDFGLAKLRPEPSLPEMSELPTESMTREGVLLGTPAYMSPEQAEGKSVDHRSDIFSLGVTFYQMLTGQRPFSGSGPASTTSRGSGSIPISWSFERFPRFAWFSSTSPSSASPLRAPGTFYSRLRVCRS
jgi:serine/threonine protein kinase